MMSGRHTASAGGVVVSSSGRVVVVSQITGTFSLPKGHVESGESLLDAAHREVHEETGLVVGEPERQFPAYTRVSGRDRDEIKSITMFLFRADGEPRLAPTDETNADARWLSVEDALATLSYAEDRDFLRGLVSEIR